MTAKDTSRNLRIGLVVTVAAIVIMVFLFFIGSEQKMFSRKNEYFVRLESAAGLAEGNPVQLSGVNIGVVKDIELPRDPKSRSVLITIMVQRKYSERIREDSRARLKKLGLIAADSYIDISPGTPTQPVLPPGSVILAQKQTSVDQLIASGEDLVDNFSQISYSLKNILQRVDRGEGLLGELTTQPPTKERLTDTLLATLNKTNAVLDSVQHGKGVLGRLVSDQKYADDLTGSLNASVHSLQAILGNVQGSLETGNGVLPALLNDPKGRERVNALVENMRITTENLAAFSNGLKNGEGLVPRLINDKEYGDQTLQEFRLLVNRLNETARKLNEGEGSAGRIISDPSLYESINDILIGINESKLLRWLVRSRQQKGIQQRYNAATRGKVSGGSEPAPPDVPLPPPPELKPQPQGTAPPATAPESTPVQLPADKPVATDTTGTAAPVTTTTTVTTSTSETTSTSPPPPATSTEPPPS